MSKRQSLRDLQSRLAEKLEAAKSGAAGWRLRGWLLTPMDQNFYFHLANQVKSIP